MFFDYSDKKEFAKLFGKYLRAESILQNYDEFTTLKALQEVDKNDANAIANFKNAYSIALRGIPILSLRACE